MPSQPTAADDELIGCPVCRAVQPLQPVCRRCVADLGLFMRAVESRRTARRRLTRATAAHDTAAERRLRVYLRWLGGST
ncbi:MAG: hypothetical protein WD060_03645 [Pirellulales bacterium]